jgi:hypothetical protein
MCIAADGSHVKTGIILPQSIPAETYSNYHPQGFIYYSTSTGYITSDVFKMHMQNIVLPEIRRRQEEETIDGKKPKALFLLDGHKSRLCLSLWEECAKSNIDVVVLPAHSSHLTQPLDATVNGIFKRSLSNLRSPPLQKSMGMEVRDFFREIQDAADKALLGTVVREGFSKTGIYPPVAEAVLDRIPESTTLYLPKSPRKERLLGGKEITSTEYLREWGLAGKSPAIKRASAKECVKIQKYAKEGEVQHSDTKNDRKLNIEKEKAFELKRGGKEKRRKLTEEENESFELDDEPQLLTPSEIAPYLSKGYEFRARKVRDHLSDYEGVTPGITVSRNPLRKMSVKRIRHSDESDDEAHEKTLSVVSVDDELDDQTGQESGEQVNDDEGEDYIDDDVVESDEDDEDMEKLHLTVSRKDYKWAALRQVKDDGQTVIFLRQEQSVTSRESIPPEVRIKSYYDRETAISTKREDFHHARAMEIDRQYQELRKVSKSRGKKPPSKRVKECVEKVTESEIPKKEHKGGRKRGGGRGKSKFRAGK